MHPNIELYEKTLRKLEEWFGALAGSVPRPTKVPFRDSFVFRHVERTPQQAIVQKLARTVSTLDAAHVLLLRGLLQEQASIQRVLDDLQEDVAFLSGGLLREWTDLHDEFLAAFFQEDLDASDGSLLPEGRPMTKRSKIRAYVARVMGGQDPSGMVKAARHLQKTYSGFVHASSPYIMDMYGGDPPAFHLRGMLGTSRATEHLHDIWNYFYRAILSFGLAAHALGLTELGNEIHAYQAEFQRISDRAH